MSNNVVGYLVQLLLVTGLMILVFGLVRRSARSLLDDVVRLPAATEFYMRVLLLLLVFAGLEAAVGDRWDIKPDPALMEYVSNIAGTMGEALQTAFWLIMIYMVLMTVLTATLRGGSSR